jgi:hypothetical protein
MRPSADSYVPPPVDILMFDDHQVVYRSAAGYYRIDS